MPIMTTQSRYQEKITVTTDPEPPTGWPENKYTTPADIHLPAREGPYVVALISGTGNVFASISSRQEVFDGTATWYEWPHGVQTGPYEPDILEEAEAIRLTSAGGDVEFEIMGIRS